MPNAPDVSSDVWREDQDAESTADHNTTASGSWGQPEHGKLLPGQLGSWWPHVGVKVPPHFFQPKAVWPPGPLTLDSYSGSLISLVSLSSFATAILCYNLHAVAFSHFECTIQ